MATILDDFKACRDEFLVMDDTLQVVLLRLNDAIVRLEQQPTTPPPTPTIRRFRITADKSLAHYFKKTNQKGKPIMIIHENPRYIYGPDKKEAPNINSGPVATITMHSAVQADGSNPGPWFTIADKRGSLGEVLYIDSQDGVIE